MKVRGLRIAMLAIIIVASMLGFTLRLARYQIIDGPVYRVQSNKTTMENIDIEAPRGQILDRYGRVLATNKVVYAIYFQYAAFPSFSKQYDKINGMLMELTEILTQNGETWNDTLPITAADPFAFTDNSTAAVKQLRNYINSFSKDKAGDNETAGQLLQRLIKYYHLEAFQPAQARVLAGIRYEMDIRDFSDLNAFTFATNIGTDTITKIRERSSVLPGVEVKEMPVRVYPDGTIAPHTIGIVGPIQQSQLEAYKKLNYSPDAIVGQGGIEQSMEAQLKGTDGTLGVEIDSLGNIVKSEVTKPSKPGNNVVLTIDADLQKVVQQSLEQAIEQVRIDSGGDASKGALIDAGSAVVMNIKTGEVLAAVNYPSYDTNTYLKNYSQLVKDPANPLYNRSIAGAYRPGSTFKPITAMAGLMNKFITGTTTINCPASIEYQPGKYFSDDNGRAWNDITVVKAIAVSSNIFFDKLGSMVGIDRIDEVAKMMGIGQKTGIEVPGESSGVLSSPASKPELHPTEPNWNYPADTMQTSIGQFDTQITPMQMVSYISTLCNYGTRYQPHMVKSILSYDNSKVIQSDTSPKIVAQNNLPKQAVDVVREGMKSVVSDASGTATSVFVNYPVQVAGKTGTAEISFVSNGKVYKGYNGVFVSFAPYDDPQYAVAVVVERGHNGYQVAPVAKAAYSYLFGLQGQGADAIPVSSGAGNTLMQ